VSIIDIKLSNRIFIYILSLIYIKYILALKKRKEKKNLIIIMRLRFRKSLKIYILFIFNICVVD